MQLRKFVKKYWEYILAFCIPLVIVLLHCMIRDSWLFGNGSILRGDAGVQYVDLYKELWNKVHNRDISFFSWNAVGGFDFYLNMLYYAISPSTLVVLLLPRNCMENALQAFMVLKWALLSFSAVYFFMHTKFNTLKENRRLVSLTFGLCYALSGFFLSTMFLFNWTDTLILFPILLLLVEQMVENGAWKLYYVLLSVAIFCNFYIAFPECIFIFLWFLLQIQTVSKAHKKVWVTFFGTSVWAALSATAVILPAVLNVKNRHMYGTSGEMYVSDTDSCISPTELVARFFPLTLGQEGNTDVYLYISIGMIVLCLLFCFIKMNKRVKYGKAGIALFLILSFWIEDINIIWHGFSRPHGYSPRFAFAFLMILTVMGLDVLVQIEKIRLWNCICVLLACIALFCYAFFHIEVYEEFYVYLFTLLGIAFYFILFVLLCCKRIKQKSFVIIFCLLCLFEICGNAYYQFSKYDLRKPDEVESIRETIELSNGLPLEKGQRVVFENAAYNGGMQTNMPSMSGFVSFSNGKLCKLMNDLGMTISVDAGIAYSGGTPLLDVMFNNAYVIGMCGIERNNADIVKEGEELKVYQVKTLAGLGYMVNPKVKEWHTDQTFSFEQQNEFATLATGIGNEGLFHTFIPERLRCTTAMGEFDIGQMDGDYFAYQYTPVWDTDGNIFKFTTDRDMNLYFNVFSDAQTIINVSIDDKIVYQYTKGRRQAIIPIGRVKKGQNISVTCAFEDQAGTEIQVAGQFAEMDEDIWDSVSHVLVENVYEITNMQSDYISGIIEPKEDGIMMTSVPVMEGFKVYVDGEQTEYDTIGGALIGVPLKRGKHVVEFRYHTPYAKLGWMISVCSIGIYILFDIIRKRQKY